MVVSSPEPENERQTYSVRAVREVPSYCTPTGFLVAYPTACALAYKNLTIQRKIDNQTGLTTRHNSFDRYGALNLNLYNLCRDQPFFGSW